MNHAMLAALLLATALPAAATVPCDILDYASQCQGSNLWPVPGGWAVDGAAADTIKGNCQPTATGEIFVPISGYRGEGVGAYAAHIGTSTSAEGACQLAIPATPFTQSGSWWCSGVMSPYGWQAGAGYTCDSNYPAVPIAWTATSPVNPRCCHLVYDVSPCGTVSLTGGVFAGTFTPLCPAGSSLTSRSVAGTTTRVCLLDNNTNAMKPSDGRCTARWTSSAKTALEKDAMDPDCEASACRLDGTCQLR